MMKLDLGEPVDLAGDSLRPRLGFSLWASLVGSLRAGLTRSLWGSLWDSLRASLKEDK